MSVHVAAWTTAWMLFVHSHTLNRHCLSGSRWIQIILLICWRLWLLWPTFLFGIRLSISVRTLNNACNQTILKPCNGVPAKKPLPVRLIQSARCPWCERRRTVCLTPAIIANMVFLKGSNFVKQFAVLVRDSNNTTEGVWRDICLCVEHVQ